MKKQKPASRAPCAAAPTHVMNVTTSGGASGAYLVSLPRRAMAHLRAGGMFRAGWRGYTGFVDFTPGHVVKLDVVSIAFAQQEKQVDPALVWRLDPIERE